MENQSNYQFQENCVNQKSKVILYGLPVCTGKYQLLVIDLNKTYNYTEKVRVYDEVSGGSVRMS